MSREAEGGKGGLFLLVFVENDLIGHAFLCVHHILLVVRIFLTPFVLFFLFDSFAKNNLKVLVREKIVALVRRQSEAEQHALQERESLLQQARSSWNDEKMDEDEVSSVLSSSLADSPLSAEPAAGGSFFPDKSGRARARACTHTHLEI